ncbi:hypothetical protein [Glaciecola sp. 1036]|uniref:hypothetical protein n=1 Tax=Alteromonadaceae TaxID=72275 RepID=UPI003D002486
MTGREFIRFISNHGIPLSCIADKLNCKLSTLKSLEKMEKIPQYYIKRFIRAFDHLLNDNEIARLAAG